MYFTTKSEYYYNWQFVIGFVLEGNVSNLQMQIIAQNFPQNAS